MGITPLCLGFSLRVGPISEISAAEILNDWEEVPFSKVLIQRNLRLTSVSQIRNSQFCPITPVTLVNPSPVTPVVVVVVANCHPDGLAPCK